MIGGDPGTYTGAREGGLDYPVPWGLIPAVYALAGEGYPKPFDTIARKAEAAEREKNNPTPSEEEILEASKRMSPIFQSLYAHDKTE